MSETVVNRIITLVNILLFFQVEFALPASSTVSSRTLISATDVPTTTYPNNMQIWDGTDGIKGITCVKLNTALKVDVKIGGHEFSEDVPITAVPEGSCDEFQQFIELSWASEIYNSTIKFFLTLYFEKGLKELAENKYVLNAAHIEWQNDTKSVDGSSGKDIMENLMIFETTIGHSFKCSDELSIKKDFGIYFYDLHFQAFDVFNSTTDFGEEDTCPKDLRFKDMGKRLTSMISLLLGCVLLLFFLTWILQQVLRKQCPIQFGYHNVN